MNSQTEATTDVNSKIINEITFIMYDDWFELNGLGVDIGSSRNMMWQNHETVSSEFVPLCLWHVDINSEDMFM